MNLKGKSIDETPTGLVKSAIEAWAMILISINLRNIII